MILEGIVTTLDADRRVNIAPMGPIVDELPRRLVLRPFQTSTTYANLVLSGQGVFHVTDDVLLLAKAAIGDVAPLPPMKPAIAIDGMILTDACRWLAFRVASIDATAPRAEIIADVVDQGTLRDFFGFNRAKHAVLEAAILATRVHLLPADEIERQLKQLAPLVDKTGGEQEREAFDLLRAFIARQAVSGS